MTKPKPGGASAPHAFPQHTSLLALACCAALAACGGGGGDSGGGEAAYPAVAATPATDAGLLGAYLGAWRGDCADHRRDSATVTRVSASVIRIAERTDYFAQADCSGAPVASVTRTADADAAYQDSIDAPVTLAPGTAPVLLRIDRVGVTLPAHTVEVAGPAVTRSLVDGRTQWCIALGEGQVTCLVDQGTIPASAGDGAFHAGGAALYRLAPQGAGYLATRRYQRQPG